MDNVMNTTATPKRTMTKAAFNALMDLRKADKVTAEYFDGFLNQRDTWVPANGGNETFTASRCGREYLYCVNPATLETGWLERGSDIVTFENPYF